MPFNRLLRAHVSKETGRHTKRTIVNNPEPVKVPSVTISVVVKAKNEGHQIRQCIESVRKLAAEVIVVDDRSTDETTRIAEECGATVIRAESKQGLIDELDFIGFNAARGSWILRLDADERMIPRLAAELRRIAESGHHSGVLFARKNIMFGGWVRRGGWFASQQLRFFRKAAWDGKSLPGLHAQVSVSGKIARLPETEELATVHYDYDDVQTFFKRTLWQYGYADAAARSAAGERFSTVTVLWRPLRRFLVSYFWRQGFRDGNRGIILAVLLAGYEFSIQANLWDIQQHQFRNFGANE